ncbi:porin [Persicitalea jodogahamensis]|uniref:Porin n=1 Tax=Persicitalea jodogahamensis TaxID=402147 RepID=A0A8J3DA55_9BACT|nr:porin [Persicitalea jodogahamensis]GHB75188.1 hypothetical protein GCM10007390_31160 [Persicitalea jodogahamensis]
MKNNWPYCLYLIGCLTATDPSLAQSDSTAVQFSGYLETYYQYDSRKPGNHQRPDFVYSHNRHNEFTLNLGYLRADYKQENVRAHLAWMVGTYANANLAAEPGVLKNIYEANAGVRLSRQKNLWLDAGILSSHIGFESAVGANCWNLTRSIMADNSPYFESGAKLTYTSDNGQWLVSGLILNGWQRIQRVMDNNTPAFGHQLTYTPNARVTLNSSSFIGSDTPDSTRRMRYFHNFYGQFALTEKWGALVGFDIGAQQAEPKGNRYSVWYAPIVQLRYALTDKARLAARAEYYDDRDGVIIASGVPGGFRVSGFSVNFDYALSPLALWRIEAKRLDGRVSIFENNDGTYTKNNLTLTTSLAIRMP